MNLKDLVLSHSSAGIIMGVTISMVQTVWSFNKINAKNPKQTKNCQLKQFKLTNFQRQ